MNRLKEFSLGIVLALLLTVIRLISTEAQEFKELEASLEQLEVKAAYKTTTSVKEQFIKDVVKNYEDTSTEEIKAPYDFIPLEDDLQMYLEERCKHYGIDFCVALALMESESNFKVDAEGDNGNSVSLFQINKVWWSWMSENHGLDVFQPKDNIEAGLIIFNDLQAKYPDDLEAVIQCYKCGEYRGAELMKEGRRLTACKIVLSRAEEFRKMKEAQE